MKGKVGGEVLLAKPNNRRKVHTMNTTNATTTETPVSVQPSSNGHKAKSPRTKAKATPANRVKAATAGKGKGKVTVAAPGKEPAVTRSNKPTNGMTGNVVRCLTVLAKAKHPMTRLELAEATGQKKGWSRMFGAVTKEGYGVAGDNGLVAKGLVKVGVPEEGQRGGTYSITPSGRKALEKASKGNA